MIDKPTASVPLPPGLSSTEEARWWDEHRAYWDDLTSVDELVDGMRVERTIPIDLRLPVALVAALERTAADRAISVHALIRQWLRERLDAERA